MDELDKKNKRTIMIAVIALVIVLVIGTTYALWQLTFTQTGTNVITTGCLQLTITEDTDAITLNEAVPMTDTEGKALTPYTFTIENTCNAETKYVVNLETVSEGDKILNDEYIKANLVKGTTEVFIDKLLPTHVNEEKVISTASAAYMLDQGTLKDKEKVTYSLRLWIASDASDVESMMDATFASKITLTATYIPKVDTKNMMIPMTTDGQPTPWAPSRGHLYNSTYTRGTKYDNFDNDTYLTKVVFESTINPYANADEIVDFSEAQDRSVLGYYVLTEELSSTKYYTLYIQADGKIKVNPIGSYYGFIYKGTDIPSSTVEGLENLDTSLVTDMSYMFWGTDNESLDLSSFDTTNVTNFSNMFDTARATTIIYGPKFIYKNNASIDSMFNYCTANKPTDASWNGLFTD